MKPANAARILRVRKNLGLSQREFAKELKVSPGAVALWETGSRLLPGPILKLMVAYEHHLFPAKRLPVDPQLHRFSDKLIEKILKSNVVNMTPEQVRVMSNGLKELIRRYLAGHLSSDPIKRTVQLSAYTKLIGQLENARGLPVKIIQLMSYLDPEMPLEIRECLFSLQSQITGMSIATITKVIREDFGRAPNEIFAEWTEMPFAKASLGQVHKARLHSGEWVAVKVQYPNIKQELEEAFNLPLVQGLMSNLLRTSGAEVLQEFKSRVLEECDYQKEAGNQDRFGEYFKADHSIYVPAVHHEFCSLRVLTTEFVQAQNFNDFVATSTQEKCNWAAEVVVRFQGESFFWHNTLHADIHPGNLLFTKDKIIFVDYGRVLFCEDSTFSILAELLVDIIHNNPVRGRKAVEKSGMIWDWTDFDFDAFWQLLREQHQHFWEDRPFSFNHKYLSRKNQLMRSFRQKAALHISGPTFWNFFVVSTHDAIRADLQAKANWRRLMLKILKKAPKIQTRA